MRAADTNYLVSQVSLSEQTNENVVLIRLKHSSTVYLFAQVNRLQCSSFITAVQ